MKYINSEKFNIKSTILMIYNISIVQIKQNNKNYTKICLEISSFNYTNK